MSLGSDMSRTVPSSKIRLSILMRDHCLLATAVRRGFAATQLVEVVPEQ
jgi:hypothetical protein